MILLPNGKLVSKEEAKQGWPIFRMGFRPFFFFGALFSALAIATWVMTFTGHMYFSPLHSPLFWHTHEMLFGFSTVIISGFLLTAVQNWTGFVTVKGKALAALFLLWLSARVLIAFELSIPTSIIILLDLAFLPSVAFFIGMAIFKAKKWRNLFFVPILLMMTILNALMYGAAFDKIQISFLSISYIMVLMVTLVMCIMGGRVFPMFTANGTKTKRKDAILWLERASIASIILCIFAAVLSAINIMTLPVFIQGLLFTLAGALNFARSIRWRVSFKLSIQTPLVSSLHLSYWAICLGLMIIGLDLLNVFSLLNFPSSAFSYHSLGIHAITVGGMGLMILSMISRVSLGHTGRELKLNTLMKMSFVFMLLGFIARVITPFFINDYVIQLYLSAGFWVLAYALFLIVYFPILFKAREDGGLG